MSNFTPLHVHSHYSLLDGLPKIPDLIGFAKNQGFSSLALTDHGVMHGAIEFYKECVAQGIKPILGVETYVAPRKLTDKQTKIDDQNCHLILLARNLTGYQNLIKLISLAHLQGFYYKPRVDHEALLQYHEGIAALSACLKGEIPQAILKNDAKAARELIKKYQTIFGPDNFYLEVQSHPELPDQIKVNNELKILAKDFSLPLVATNDSHYLHPEDAEAQDILVCVQTGKTVNDEKRLDMRKVDTSLKNEESMRRDLPEFIEAIENTGKLAAELNVELPLGQRFFPNFPTPEGETPEAYLRLLAEQGLTKHYTTGVPDSVRERLEYELGIIMKKGYSSYFLVVADFVNWSKEQAIIATTRGSAAGSLVSYLIGITNLNPLEYGLPFERFLNPERPSPPDIDMDFADDRRDDVIAYVTAKYGLDRVAQIVTFGTMQARAAIRDVGRALGYPYSLCDKVAKMIPFGSQGFHMTIDRALNENAELKDLTNTDPQVKKLLDLARKVEGCARHASVHAAGIVISPEPLTNYVPLQYDSDGKAVITQYDMFSCEEAGLVKMDFLGIRNLSIMGSAIKIIQKTKNVTIDLNNLPLGDAKTFELMARGETMGMFQLGGSGMTRYLKELKPTAVTDIMAMVALFRPGPMNSIPEFIKRKHNPKTITYLDPRLKDILHASYGIITYQDDVLLIAINLAGYSWEEADKLRKAMGKKILKEMARQKEKFISGAIARGLTEDKARHLWELIEPFAAYGFNKAHAASYGMVAYQTAYLKASYPTEFMAALMTAESANMETIAQAVAECTRLGIQVLPPDINESLSTFTVVDDTKIRFGMGAIKNLGENTIEVIIRERKKNELFNNLEDFLKRVAGHELNKKSLESLIKTGALDSFGYERRQLVDSIEILLNFARERATERTTNQSSLFGGALGAPELKLKLPALTSASMNQAEKLLWEKELLGLYVTAHPFNEYAQALNNKVTPLNLLSAEQVNKNIVIAGYVTQIKQINTKKGEAMAFLTLEDTTSNIEVVIFPETYRTYKNILNSDTIIGLCGKWTARNDSYSLIMEGVCTLNSSSDAWQNLQPIISKNSRADSVKKDWSKFRTKNNPPKTSTPATPPPEVKTNTVTNTTTSANFIIKLPVGIAPEIMDKLKIIIQKYPGENSVVCEFNQNGLIKKILTLYKVAQTMEMETEINNLLKK